MKRLFSYIWLYVKSVLLTELAITGFIIVLCMGEAANDGHLLDFSPEQYVHFWIVLSIINPVFWLLLAIYSLIKGE